MPTILYTMKCNLTQSRSTITPNHAQFHNIVAPIISNAIKIDSGKNVLIKPLNHKLKLITLQTITILNALCVTTLQPGYD